MRNPTTSPRRRSVRRWKLKKYGVTDLESAEIRFEALQGRCELCGQREEHRELNIDHNHETGKFRGFLCTRCNVMLGQLEHSPGFRKKVNIYLDRGVSDLVQ